MMVVKKDFIKDLSVEDKVKFDAVKAFIKEKEIDVFISKEVVGKGQLGLDITMWVLIVSKKQMIIKKDIQEKPLDLLASMEKLVTDYDYE